MSSAETTTRTDQTEFADQAAAFLPLVGQVLGRRERNRGPLREFADIHVERIVEPVDDLAVADRVAFVLAWRTKQAHAVIATATTYLVVAIDARLDAADVHSIVQPHTAPRLISVATESGITPVLTPLNALPSTALPPHHTG